MDMIVWQDTFHKWQSEPALDKQLKEQINLLKHDPIQLEDSFYKYLEFGTGGMRGIIGPGTNRINIYTIRKAAEGLARYIVQNGREAMNRGVVIAYDSRHKSKEFAIEAAKTIGHHGIHVYVFESLRSTPELSFAVRYLHAYSGIVITASHNPSEYNGFKVYNEDGAQFASEEADMIVSYFNEVDNELEIKVSEEEELRKNGLLTFIGDKIDQEYLQRLQSITLNKKINRNTTDDLKIVYTPLHGTGKVPVEIGLKAAGFKYVHIVKEQSQPDPNFPTVEFPNPEDPQAFTLAIEYGEKLDAHILLATDPDTDRVGVAIRTRSGTYHLLNGNQIGALLLHYLITEKQKRNELPKNAAVLKTIVTSELGREIAKAYGIETIDTLTGFKYISAKIKEFEKTGDRTFLFGYEESYGYLIGDFVRDKDAVQACLIIAEAAAFYRAMDMTLYDVLLNIYEQYGYYKEGMESLTLEGKSGIEKIESILYDLRNDPPLSFAGKKVLEREDYLTGERTIVNEDRIEKINLPTSNVLKYKLEDQAWVCVRPSGTEPKIKFYFGVRGESLKESEQTFNKLKNAVMEI